MSEHSSHLKVNAEKLIGRIGEFMPVDDRILGEGQLLLERNAFAIKLSSISQARGIVRLCAAYIDEPARIKPFFIPTVVNVRHIYCIHDLLSYLLRMAEHMESQLPSAEFSKEAQALLLQSALFQCELSQDVKFGLSRPQ